MKTESIKCDNCNEEMIEDSAFPHRYGLELNSIDTNRNTSGYEYGVGMSPIINSTKHFCSKSCLSIWSKC